MFGRFRRIQNGLNGLPQTLHEFCYFEMFDPRRSYGKVSLGHRWLA